MAFVYAYFFSDFLCFDMSLLLLTVTLRGVSNKHCLLSFFFICVRPGRKPRRPVFSQQGSYFVSIMAMNDVLSCNRLFSLQLVFHCTFYLILQVSVFQYYTLHAFQVLFLFKVKFLIIMKSYNFGYPKYCYNENGLMSSIDANSEDTDKTAQEGAV